MNPRILFLATFPPPVHGSAVVSQQIKESRLINETFKGDYVNIATSRGLDEKKNYFIKLMRFAASFSRTFWLLLTRRYDLCYCAITCHGGCFLRDAPYVLLCKLFGRRVVIHQHNKGMSQDVDKPVFRWIYPMVYKNVKVILLSWQLYSDIEKIVRRENVMICPNGIKPSADPDFVHITNTVPQIFFLSNLLIDKGVLVLLDALRILKDEGYCFVCDFVGSETHDISAKRFGEEVGGRGLDQMAIYRGRKHGDEKKYFFEKTDIFVFPSLNEAFGLVAVEAMEYGIPVIASNEGGIPDIIEDGINGLLVEKNNPADLASAIKKLIVDSSLRAQMGQAGHRKYEERFTEEQFEKTMVKCLETAMIQINK